MKNIASLLVLISLLFSSAHAGWKWNTVKKAGMAYGAVKAYKAYKKKHPKSKIFTKKEVNGRTAYQRDIDPDLLVTKTTKGKTTTLTNLERTKDGKSPHVKKNGKIEEVQLHHSRQNNKGSLFELSKSTHQIKNKNKGGNALHPYGKNKHPNNPVPKNRNEFNKEKEQYWKSRAEEIEKFKEYGNVNK